MAGFIDNLLGPLRRRSVSPTSTAGAPGFAVYGGFVQEDERDSSLTGERRYKTFSDLLANVSIVAAGTRYFLNLASKAGWSFEPAEADVDGRFAELAEAMLTEDPATSWHRVVRRACMYRFYGFSIQEWTARRHQDGHLTFADVAPRAQRTIERWDTDEEGTVRGVLQRSPQTHRELYIPRQKVVYVVDDSLSDSPDGMGLFRHLVEPTARLRRYEQLEGFGFETDLRGMPVGRGPFAELAKAVAAGDITEVQRAQMEKPMRDFIKSHIKSPKLGLLLDSQPYTTTDDATRPSGQLQWDMELLSATVGTQEQVGAAVSRVTTEIARVLGVENLLTGSEGTGSLALSRDKSHNFFLVVDGTLKEVREAFADDLLFRAWQLNGWPEEMMPALRTEAVQFKDIEQITSALRDMAMAGAVLEPDDPAIGEVRDLIGLSHPPDRLAIDAALGNDDDGDGDDDSVEGSSEDEDEMPEDENNQ